MKRLRARVRWAIVCIRWALAVAAYRVRPFDAVADRRRWAWQKPQRCLSYLMPVMGVCRLNQTPHWCMVVAYEEAEIAAKLFGRRRTR